MPSITNHVALDLLIASSTPKSFTAAITGSAPESPNKMNINDLNGRYAGVENFESKVTFVQIPPKTTNKAMNPFLHATVSRKANIIMDIKELVIITTIPK